MTDRPSFADLLAASAQPVCARLTPFTVLEDSAEGVAVAFDAQPAFGNHFDHVQGGFAAAMLDTVISLAGFRATGRWLPTASLHVMFLRPVPIAPCRGEAKVLKAGRVCFVEARLIHERSVLVTAQASLANSAQA